MDATKKSPLNKVYTSFLVAVTPHVTATSRVCVGLSGGVDSIVLLHLFSQLRLVIPFDLSALHVHHGISQHADDWLIFCQHRCNELNIPFIGQRANLNRNAASGLEAEARAARYQHYAQQVTDFIALAHHRDDQAETLMLQLLRGAGAKGLAAMSKYRIQPNQPTYLRPLLDVDRSDIIAWAQAHQLNWVEDDSNTDTHYARNFLRHHFLPLLNQRYPAWRTTMARSASNLAEAATLLDELAAIDAQLGIDDQRLSCHHLRCLSPTRTRNLLRYFFTLHRTRMPSQARLDDMLAQLSHVQHNNHLAIEHDEHTLYCYQDYAYLVKNKPRPGIQQRWLWQDTTSLILPLLGTLHFQPGLGTGIKREQLVDINIRLRSGGEVFRPDRKRPNRRLKDLFQLSHIPPWQRDYLPLIYSGDTLIHVPGIGTACKWQANQGEDSIEITWHAEN